VINMETISKTHTMDSFGSWSLCEHMELYEQATYFATIDNRAASHFMKLSLYKIIDAIVDEDNVTGNVTSPDVLNELCNHYETYLRNSLKSTIQCLKLLDEMRAITVKENKKRG
jgi:hypothetical protein